MNSTTDTTAGAQSSTPEPKPKQHLSKDGKWRYFRKVPGLIQYVITGNYFARVKIKGKSVRKSLETDVYSTAKLKLPDVVKEIRKPKAAVGTFAEARLLYEADLAADHTLKPASKYYRQTRIAALLKSWPTLDGEQLPRLAARDARGRFRMETEFRDSAKRFAEKFDEQNFNNTLGTLRAILERGGVGRQDNPAYEIDRLGVKPTELQLPEADQFEKLLETIETAGAPQSRDCADLVRFLAYSGCRIAEARQVTWAEVDLKRGSILVHNGKRSLKSNQAATRLVPIIPPMRQLLERLQTMRHPEPTQAVCVLGECEKSLTRACKLVGISRLTHHDLRHLFASVCIESEIDIPTLSRWLGHSDGGALAMRVYGHLRERHSQKMAAKVTFGQQHPENVQRIEFAHN